MAIIRDFLKEKERRQLDSDIDYREKIRAHKLSVFLRTVVISVGIVLFVLLANVLWEDKTYTVISVENSYPVSLVTGTSAANLNGSLLMYSKDGASCVDIKGKATWNQSFEMQTPIVSICNDTVAIGDYNGRSIYVANSSRILGVVKTNLPIRALTVSDNGVVAAVLDDSDVTRIYVYDGNTDTDTPIVEAKATMSKSGYPISVSLSPNGKIMMISYFYVDSGNMKSSVAFYNFGEVGSNEADNYVSGYDYVDTVIPYVEFMDNDSAFAVADDRIVFFQGSEKPVNNATAMIEEEILGVYSNDEYVGLVFTDNTGNSRYKLDVFSASGNKISSIPIDIEYTDIVFNKDQIVIHDGNKMLLYNVKGTEKFNGSFNKNVNILVPINSSIRYMVAGSDSLDVIELH